MAVDRVQRRMAAILAADVVGYSRLMGKDEEKTLATLKTYRSIIDSLIARRGPHLWERRRQFNCGVRQPC